jgi:predicted transcriptional regulator
MPCIDSSGQLTTTAGTILAAMTNAVPLNEVAQKTGLALYQVRSAARELLESGLARETDGMYVVSETGRAALEKLSAKT